MARRDLFSLEGKVALVTGGGRGIGRFISEGLAGAGSDLIITSRQRDILEQAAAEMQGEFGVRVEPLACDLGEPAEIEKMFEAATSASIRAISDGSGSKTFISHRRARAATYPGSSSTAFSAAPMAPSNWPASLSTNARLNRLTGSRGSNSAAARKAGIESTVKPV